MRKFHKEKKKLRKNKPHQRILNINHSRMKRHLQRLGYGIYYGAIYVLMSILVAYVGNIKFHTSTDILALKTRDDWIVTGVLTGIMLTMLFVVYLFYKHRKSGWGVIAGNLALFCFTNSFAYLLMQAIIQPYNTIRATNVRKVMKLTSYSYVEMHVLLALSLFLAICLSWKWINRNNWYGFVLVVPYILADSYVYRYQASWHDFSTMSSFSQAKFANMFANYGHYSHGVAPILMNDAIRVAGFLMIISCLILIIIGGEYLAYVAQKKAKLIVYRRHQKEAKQG